jgi:hypothetical protein
MILIGQLADIWARTAHYDLFGNAISAAFASDLAYPILWRLGRFSDTQISSWVDGEKLRIIPAMAENEKFDEEKFSKTLDRIEQRLGIIPKICNWIAVRWAIAAAIFSVAMLFFIPYYHDAPIMGADAFLWALGIGGATPIGVLVFYTTHWIARYQMKLNSKQFNSMIEFTKQTQQEKIAATRTALAEKLKAARGF